MFDIAAGLENTIKSTHSRQVPNKEKKTFSKVNSLDEKKRRSKEKGRCC